MSETQRPEGRMTAGGGLPMLDIATRWQEEMVRFCGLRMSRYFELSGRLWECRSPSDVLRLQTSFVQNMLADYTTQSEVLSGQLLKAQKATASDKTGPIVPSYEAAILQAQKDAGKIIDLAKDQAARILNDAEARVAEASSTRRDKRNKSATG